MYPPSTTIFCPVIHLEASDNKKTTVEDISAGSPNPKGNPLILFSRSSLLNEARNFSINGVSIVPGETQFTLIFLFANSTAITRAALTTAPLEAEYAATPLRAITAVMEAIKITPPDY